MYETRVHTEWATRAVWDTGNTEVWPVDDEVRARERVKAHEEMRSRVTVTVVKREVITLIGEWTEV